MLHNSLKVGLFGILCLVALIGTEGPIYAQQPGVGGVPAIQLPPQRAAVQLAPQQVDVNIPPPVVNLQQAAPRVSVQQEPVQQQVVPVPQAMPRAQVYSAPVYQQPIYQQPIYQAPAYSYAAPVYAAPVHVAARAVSYAAAPVVPVCSTVSAVAAVPASNNVTVNNNTERRRGLFGRR